MLWGFLFYFLFSVVQFLFGLAFPSVTAWFSRRLWTRAVYVLGAMPMLVLVLLVGGIIYRGSSFKAFGKNVWSAITERATFVQLF